MQGDVDHYFDAPERKDQLPQPVQQQLEPRTLLSETGDLCSLARKQISNSIVITSPTLLYDTKARTETTPTSLASPRCLRQTLSFLNMARPIRPKAQTSPSTQHIVVPIQSRPIPQQVNAALIASLHCLLAANRHFTLASTPSLAFRIHCFSQICRQALHLSLSWSEPAFRTCECGS